MLNNKIKKKTIKKRQKNNNPSQLKLTCQTHNSGHETRITSLKEGQNKLWNPIQN